MPCGLFYSWIESIWNQTKHNDIHGGQPTRYQNKTKQQPDSPAEKNWLHMEKMSAISPIDPGSSSLSGVYHPSPTTFSSVSLSRQEAAGRDLGDCGVQRRPLVQTSWTPLICGVVEPTPLSSSVGLVLFREKTRGFNKSLMVIWIQKRLDNSVFDLS